MKQKRPTAKCQCYKERLQFEWSRIRDYMYIQWGSVRTEGIDYTYIYIVQYKFCIGANLFFILSERTSGTTPRVAVLGIVRLELQRRDLVKSGALCDPAVCHAKVQYKSCPLIFPNQRRRTMSSISETVRKCNKRVRAT